MTEDDCRPMSAWTKGAILDAIQDATIDRGISADIGTRLAHIPLEDLRAIFLKWAYSKHAGWVDGDTEGKPGRWTHYYELDTDAVGSLMEGSE